MSLCFGIICGVLILSSVFVINKDDQGEAMYRPVEFVHILRYLCSLAGLFWPSSVSYPWWSCSVVGCVSVILKAMT